MYKFLISWRSIWYCVVSSPPRPACPDVEMVMAIDHTMDELSTVRRNVDEKKAVIIDVREESEWKAGHLNAATHLPLSEIRKNLDVEAVKKNWLKNKIVYTHCKVGARALTSARSSKNSATMSVR